LAHIIPMLCFTGDI